MRFKIDENLHPETAALLASAGHDVATVFEQDYAGIAARKSQTLVVRKTAFLSLLTKTSETFEPTRRTSILGSSFVV